MEGRLGGNLGVEAIQRQPMTEGSNVIRFPERRVAGEVWEPWVDEHSIAQHFGVSTRTVRRWRTEGMPSKLIGGSRRFKLSQAESWHDRPP